MIGLNSKTSHDSRAVVTGAGSGIGRAFAIELSKRGGRVVVSDRDLVAAQRTADQITDHGSEAVAVECDVTRAEDVQTLAGRAREWFEGPPTLVINNAGIGAGGSEIGSTPLSEWQRTLDVNLWGVIHGCHVFTPMLREAGGGGIINVSSAASFGAAPGMAAYNVSKAGVLSLSETLAAELSGSGVKVSVLCPTFVKTNILSGELISDTSRDAATTLMRFAGMSADKVAKTCLDRHDKGGLYVVPQLDAKLFWQLKRHAPAAFTLGAGLLGRISPLRDDPPKDTQPKTQKKPSERNRT